MLSCFKLKSAAARVTLYVRPTLYSITHRHYASAIDSISLKRQQEIAAALRAYQKENKAVPWFDMTNRFEISQAIMEQVLAANDARMQKMEQSIHAAQFVDNICSYLRPRYKTIDSISLEQQQEIAEALRAYYKDGEVPWLDMIKRYRVPRLVMEQALIADDARLQKRAELSMRVTQLADQTYSEQRGRCDWESVAQNMEMSLIECLWLFDPLHSTVPVRSLLNIADWSAEDLLALKSFVSEQCDAVTADKWRLVSVYMNVDQADCFMAYNMCTFPQMSSDLHEAITQHRNNGMQWNDIFEQFPIYGSLELLCNLYHQFKEPSSKPKVTHTEWTDEETWRLKEIIQIHKKPENPGELLSEAQKAFPSRSQESIRGKIIMITHTASFVTNRDMDRVNKLVGMYGENWAHIGKEICVSSQCAEWMWGLHQQRQKATQEWTEDELKKLRKCIRDGTGMTMAMRVIGTKTLEACYAKRIL